MNPGSIWRQGGLRLVVPAFPSAYKHPKAPPGSTPFLVEGMSRPLRWFTQEEVYRGVIFRIGRLGRKPKLPEWIIKPGFKPGFNDFWYKGPEIGNKRLHVGIQSIRGHLMCLAGVDTVPVDRFEGWGLSRYTMFFIEADKAEILLEPRWGRQIGYWEKLRDGVCTEDL